jgi:hypothetical protein
MLLQLENPDLGADSGACWVMKDEVVSVEFAASPGMLESAVGLNRSVGGDLLRGNAGDWLVQYAPGDHGIVAAARFDRVYRAQG